MKYPLTIYHTEVRLTMPTGHVQKGRYGVAAVGMTEAAKYVNERVYRDGYVKATIESVERVCKADGLNWDPGSVICYVTTCLTCGDC